MRTRVTTVLVIILSGWVGEVLANGGEIHENVESSIFKTIIIPFGVATLFSVMATITLGLKMAKNRAAIFPWHRRMALFTMLLAVCHATLVIIFH